MYRIILTKNKKHKKILHKCKEGESALEEFKNLIAENVVLFPKRFVNYGKITNVQYELLLLKKRKDGDKNRMVRNELGQLVEEIPSSAKWVILDKHPYQVEETFWVWGHDSKADRFDAKRIVQEILLKGIRKKYMVKQVVIVHNKLIISSDLDDFSLIICKCQDDAIRLHNALKQAVINSRIKNILFFGLAKPKQISDMYEIIMEHTGWDRMQVRRLSTRH
jgi:hypothetical protein